MPIKPVTPDIVDPTLHARLIKLFSEQAVNIKQICEIIAQMVRQRPDGANNANKVQVVQYLATTDGIHSSTLMAYAEIGLGEKLLEVFQLHTAAGRAAWCLDAEKQKRIYFKGVPVIQHAEGTASNVLLKDLNEKEALRVIDTKNGRIRTVEQQRQIYMSAPTPKRSNLLEFWTKNDNCYVRPRRRLSVADLEYLVQQLKANGLYGYADTRAREQIDEDLSRQFSQSHGKSQA